MASIHKKGDVYYVVYRSDGKQTWEPAGARKRDALKLKTQREHELQTGQLITRAIGCADLCDEWLAGKKGEVAGNTHKGYIIGAQHISDFFRDGPVRLITRQDCQRFRDEELERGLSTSTVQKDMTQLRSIFEYAIEEGYLNKNPARKVTVSTGDAYEPVIATPAELASLFEHADPLTKLVMIALLVTGMRTSEVRALKKEDIRPDKERLYVRRAFARDRSTSRTKTNAAMRAIDAPSDVLYALMVYSDDAEYVFPELAEKKQDWDDFVKWTFNPLKTRAKVRKEVQLRNFRHLCSSVLEESAEFGMKYAQEQLGHTNISMTGRYTRPLRHRRDGIGDRLHTAFDEVLGVSVRKMLEASGDH